MFKSKTERYDDARRLRIEKIALWLVRWSQVLFWVGAVTIIVDCLYWTFTAIDRVQGAVCGVVGVLSILSMLLGGLVFIKSVMVDEHGKRGSED